MRTLFHVPAGMPELREHLATDARYAYLTKPRHWDKVLYVVYTVKHYQYWSRDVKDRWCALSMDTLQSLLGNPYAQDIVEMLRENNVLERNDYYRPTAKRGQRIVRGQCRTYRLTPYFEDQESMFAAPTNQRLLARITEDTGLSTVERYLASCVRRAGVRYLDLLYYLDSRVGTWQEDETPAGYELEEDETRDYSGELAVELLPALTATPTVGRAWAETDGFPEWATADTLPDDVPMEELQNHLAHLKQRYGNCAHSRQRYLSAFMVFAKQHRFIVDKTAGRVHTNITAFATDCRQFLTMDGHSDLINVDIAASQLVFSLVPLVEYYKAQGGTMPPDVVAWVDLVTDSKRDVYREFYARMYGREPSDSERNGFKKTFFQRYKYCKSIFNVGPLAYHESNVIARDFPSVMAWVLVQKQHGHNQYAIAMQKAEKTFIIDTMAYELMSHEVCVWTIHDSNVVRRSNALFAQRYKQTYFRNLLAKELNIRLDALDGDTTTTLPEPEFDSTKAYQVFESDAPVKKRRIRNVYPSATALPASTFEEQATKRISLEEALKPRFKHGDDQKLPATHEAGEECPGSDHSAQQQQDTVHAEPKPSRHGGSDQPRPADSTATTAEGSGHEPLALAIRELANVADLPLEELLGDVQLQEGLAGQDGADRNAIWPLPGADAGAGVSAGSRLPARPVAEQIAVGTYADALHGGSELPGAPGQRAAGLVMRTKVDELDSLDDDFLAYAAGYGKNAPLELVQVVLVAKESSKLESTSVPLATPKPKRTINPLQEHFGLTEEAIREQHRRDKWLHGTES
jgi:hypothetical protein